MHSYCEPHWLYTRLPMRRLEKTANYIKKRLPPPIAKQTLFGSVVCVKFVKDAQMMKVMNRTPIY